MKKNNVINEMGIQVKSIAANEGIVRRAIGELINIYTNDPEVLSDFKISVSEAVTNCITHAYAEKPGIIYVYAKIFEDGKVQIKIKDNGCGIESIEKAKEVFFSTKPEHAGLGFTIMSTLIGKIQVKSTVGKGTTVILEKKLRLYE